jgi:AraC family transcriptional regulator
MMLSMRKGKQMNVTYEKKNALTFIGYHTEIRPEEAYQKCPEFWNKDYAAKYARLWQTMQPENAVEKAVLDNGIGMFAICAEAENGFSYWIAGLYKGGEVPEGLELYSFPAGNWAVFSAKGPIPESLQTLNTAVWNEWLPNEGRKLHANASATVEMYSAGNPQSPEYESAIWIPISGECG